MTNKIIRGILKTWKEDRGFGFIKPDNGGKDIFIHISALKGMSRRPLTGDVILYQVARDNRGKYKAINAQIEDTSLKNVQENLPTTGNSKKGFFAVAAGVLFFIITAGFIYTRWAN